MEVKAVQLVAGLFRIHDIFKDDESGSLGVVRDALADLAKATLVSDVILSAATVIPIDLPHWPKLAKQLKQLFWRYVVAQVLDKESAEGNISMQCVLEDALLRTG